MFGNTEKSLRTEDFLVASDFNFHGCPYERQRFPNPQCHISVDSCNGPKILDREDSLVLGEGRRTRES